MKRSQAINLTRMRKASGVFALKPLAFCVALLVGCGSNTEEQADIFKNLEECKTAYPDLSAQCEIAFNNALASAEATAPKYNSQEDCAADFGADRCIQRQHSDGQSWFMPAMAGFMLGRALDSGRYQSAPMFTSSNYSSPYYNRWTTVDGNHYGNYGSRSQVRVDRSAFKPKPTVTKTISRGGFGSKAAAASSWSSTKSSGSRSGSSWGG